MLDEEIQSLQEFQGKDEELYLLDTHQLEAENRQEGISAKGQPSKQSASDGIQLSFFQLDDPVLSSLKEDLDAADINNMTPLQAFDLLRSMKEKMGLK